jgi:uroporphyrinogen-III synthase
MKGLRGCRVAILESRMSSELAELIRRQGGEPYCVPAVRETRISCGQQVAAFIDDLSNCRFQVVIFLTGVGVKALFEEAQQLGRLQELLAGLKQVALVCRGPKPLAVLSRSGLRVSRIAQEPYTTRELLDAIAGLDLSKEGVALIHYGERNQALAEALRARAANLRELCLYEWLMPEDTGALSELIREIIKGRVDAVVFTCQIQVRHLFQIAEELGQVPDLVNALNTRTIVASIGPTCTAVLEGFRVSPHVLPQHPKMGHLVSALAQYIEQTPLQAAQ